MGKQGQDFPLRSSLRRKKGKCIAGPLNIRFAFSNLKRIHGSLGVKGLKWRNLYILGLGQLTWHLGILNPVFLGYENPLCWEEVAATV